MPNRSRPIPSLLTVRALSGSTAELLIYGDIGESWAATSVTAQSVVERLGTLDGVTEITVRINSHGGSVADGLAIFNALKRHPARKVVLIDGIAASIATVIAMAGDTVSMPRTALFMVHAPWSPMAGNALELRQHAAVLDGWAAVMAEAYSAKSGMAAAELLKSVLGDGQDHWYTADEAKAAGFIDAVIEPEQSEAAAGFDAPAYARNVSRLIPRAPAHIAARLQPMIQGEPNMPTAVQREEIIAAERDRRTQIRSMAGEHANNPAYRDFVNASLDDPEMTPEVFGHAMLRRLGAGAEPIAGWAGGFASEGGGDFLAAASDALVMRAGIPVETPHAGARDFMPMDTASIARACLARAGRSSRDLDRVGAIRAAMTTSDFPALLGNALAKSLRQGYEVEPQSHRLWGRFIQVEDFRPQVRALLSSAPELQFVSEGGEYQRGGLSDDKAEYAVAKFGRIISLTWEALVNDDLGAFIRIPQAMGQAARRKEADVVYGLFAANAGAGPNMHDGKTLFHLDHANVAASTAALDAAALSAARTLLRKQTAKGGGLLNLQPRYLIIPAEMETAAETLLATSQRAATQADSVLPGWIGGLIPVVEPRLSASAFYLAAASDQVDTLEVAGLAADGGQPQVSERDEFERDSRAWKVRHVLAAAFPDWRGIVKVPVA